ncbi:hypothetical protein N8A98_00570 (plasmid) [Devosia neptuniae]|uniref:Uncharacterized protein n=1 Tax=Devosia neptuniae TaxID=191302 RepID=A0ABY6C9U0_9HYPH|nr:hypothetical protein [Devosia neptuniae]UXN68046.1 hypothetical protein N8A98_00570 [Devosia neptuniae]
MEIVDSLIIDEIGKSIRFLQDGSDVGITGFNEVISTFRFTGLAVSSVSMEVQPIQVFTLDKEKGIATHSYVLPEGIAATTWNCQIPSTQ